MNWGCLTTSRHGGDWDIKYNVRVITKYHEQEWKYQESNAENEVEYDIS